MLQGYSPPEVDRTWGIWGSYYNMPKAIFYLLKGDYTLVSTDMGTRISLLFKTSSRTRAPKVCRIMAFWAFVKGFGPLFYLLLGTGSQDAFRLPQQSTAPVSRLHALECVSFYVHRLAGLE